MTDAGTSFQQPALRPRQWAAAALLGCWAAAVALAHGLAAKAALVAPALALPAIWWTLRKPARWIALFFVTALLLPPLPIPIGDSGPHPSLAVAALGLFAGILWLGDWRMRPSGLNAAFALLFGALAASVAPAAFHSGALVAAASLARVALFGISLYVFFYTACGPARDTDPYPQVRLLYWVAVAAALFACIDFYFQFPAPAGYGPQFVWLDSGVYRRAQGLFYEASTLGNFCAFFLVMIAVSLSRPAGESPVSRKALWAGGAVFFAALAMSYSRASLVTVLVACAVLLWTNRKRVRLVRAAALLTLGALGGALVVWKLFPGFAEMYWLRLSRSAEYLFTSTNGVLSGRLESWRALTAWMEAHPWTALVGIGYKTLPYTDAAGSAVIADNMYLSLLAETGVVGLAALVWVNWAILRAAARASRAAGRASGRPSEHASETRRAFFGTWMLCFWTGQTIQMLSGDLLTYWRVLPVYFWVLALAVRA
ncbi:MAG: O-antigen ligase family protein [Bryobacteraceae bacterium]